MNTMYLKRILPITLCFTLTTMLFSKPHEPLFYETNCLITSGLVLIDAEVGGESGLFILDTGSPDIVVHDSTKNNPLRTFYRYECSNRTTHFSMGPWSWQKMEVCVQNLDHLARKLGFPIKGILGHSFLENYEFLIDFDKQIVQFHCIDSEGARLGDLHSESSFNHDCFDLRFKGHLPVIGILIEGSLRSMVLDTGGGISYISRNIFNQMDSPVKMYNLQANTIAGITHREVQARLLEIFVAERESVDLTFFQIDINELNHFLEGEKLDGILGYNFLVRNNVLFNFKAKTVKLWDREKIYQSRILTKN